MKTKEYEESMRVYRFRVKVEDSYLYYVSSVKLPAEYVNEYREIVFDDSELLEIKIYAPVEERQSWDIWMRHQVKLDLTVEQIDSDGENIKAYTFKSAFPIKRQGSNLDYLRDEIYSEVYQIKFVNPKG